MARTETTTDDALADVEGARRLFRLMVLIRRFEERTEEQYTRARIGGYCHLAIGEEASHVGAIDALEDGDYLFASYRDHGTALAVGSSPAAVMAELFGKATGVAGGYGGSMHLLDVERHFLGGWGIVGGQLPIAVGAALALDYRDEPAWCSASWATARPTSARSTRRSTWRRSGTSRSSSRSSTTSTAWARPSSRPRASPSCGGAPRPTACTASAWTATTCWPCARPPSRLARLAREERRPSLLETTTYRFRGHSVADAGKVYRSEEEIAHARERDPILRYELLLRERGLLSEDDAAEIRREVNEEVAGAIQEAAAAPAPDPARIYDNVYGDPATAEQFSRMGLAAPFGESEETRAWRT